METPVFLFTGFLDAGKTKFIQSTLEDARFANGTQTLVLLFEDGDEELDETKFVKPASFHIEMIYSKEDMTVENLTALQKKHKAKRVVVEYNGMWLLNDFFEAMPDGWLIYQEITFANSEDYVSYNANMRNLVGDKLKNADMVIFNRFTPEKDKMVYHKIVRSCTRGANIIYDFGDHAEPDDIVDPLPFDVNAPIVTIGDSDYGLWYGDLQDKEAEYEGKIVKFTGLVAKKGKLPPNGFVIGRHIMTCCAADVVFGGLACSWSGVNLLNHMDWVNITARVKIEQSKIYGGDKGPVLYVMSCEKVEKPDPEVVTFG